MSVPLAEPAEKRPGSADRCKIFVAQQSLGEDGKDSVSLLFWDTGRGILRSTPRRRWRKCLKAKAKSDHVTRLAMLTDLPTKSRAKGKRLTVAGMTINTQCTRALGRP